MWRRQVEADTRAEGYTWSGLEKVTRNRVLQDGYERDMSGCAPFWSETEMNDATNPVWMPWMSIARYGYQLLWQ